MNERATDTYQADALTIRPQRLDEERAKLAAMTAKRDALFEESTAQIRALTIEKGQRQAERGLELAEVERLMTENAHLRRVIAKVLWEQMQEAMAKEIG